MDPTIGWYQPEQYGPAKDLWLHIWEAEKGLDVLTLRNDANTSNAMGVRLQQDFLALDTSPAAVATTAAGTTPSSNTTNAGFGTGNNGNGNGGGGNAGNNSNGSNGRTASVVHGSTAGNGNGEHRVPHNACNYYYNPSRRKGDNRASTYGMNYNYDALVGEYGGCPWRMPNKHYSMGTIG